MNLRAYAPGDEAALAEIWFGGWLSVGLEHPVVTKAELAERLRRELAERWELTVAEADGRLLGFLAIVQSEQRLDQLFVAPEAQGRGIGRLLFEVAKQRMPDGFWLSTQPANARARGFYERSGMRFDRLEAGHTGERAVYVFP
jgi:putative acetyltransferase